MRHFLFTLLPPVDNTACLIHIFHRIIHRDRAIFPVIFYSYHHYSQGELGTDAKVIQLLWIKEKVLLHENLSWKKTCFLIGIC